MSIWSPEENATVVDLYFEMLLSELRGQPYNKSDHNRRVQARTGRSRASIEFKFCNISAVLQDLQYPFVDGYKPRTNAQQSLWAVVKERLATLDADLLEELVRLQVKGRPKNMAEEDGSPLSFWEFSGRLWDRTTGGTDVAARPDNPVDDFWPTAMRPPGVEEGLAWLKADRSENIPRWLFLAGGPGAGKSHATATASAGMRLASQVDAGLANRNYEYIGEDSNLFILNDATISSGAAKTPLIQDLSRLAQKAIGGAGKPTDAVACVNRGIFIEELAALDADHAEEGAGAAVLQWLSGTKMEVPLGLWHVECLQGESYARSAQLTYRHQLVAHMVAVSVDECSLFEKRPGVLLNDSAATSADYDITALEDRRRIPDQLMPAADLLNEILNILETVTPDITEKQLVTDPISANAANLKSQKFRSSLFTVARSAEIAGSSRMTYRELWGFIVRAFVGGAPQDMARNQLRGYVESLQPLGLNPAEDFKRIRKLAELRVHQAIFGGPILTGDQKGLMSDPVLRIMRLVDPLRDALPGNSPFDPQKGWASPIAEAFTSHITEQSPLEVLERYDLDHHLAVAVTDFDRKVDECFTALLNIEDLKDEVRIDAVAWYGGYLTRLYATAFGISAFRNEISILVKANRQDRHLPDSLQTPLRTLIRPKRTPDSAASESLIPLYDSRTDPVTGILNAPKLALRVGDLELRSERASGEQTLLTIYREGQLMAKMALDFALVREALTCAGESAGVTDLVEMTAPRLERIRAARLLVEHLSGAEVRIIDGESGHQISHRRAESN